MTTSIITIGCDPEMFLVDILDKTPQPAFNTIPGNKQMPFPVPGGAIQVDGMAVEININPSRTRQEFMANINQVMGGLTSSLPPTMEIAHGVPFMDFGAEAFVGLPPEATELGCEPDYNAYTGKASPRPDGVVTYRTAAGHIHVGWGCDVDNPFSSEHFQLCCDMAKQLDYYVGIYALQWDKDDRRRSLYGKAGAFRPKRYGLEYRTPSTAWLASEHLQAWVFDAAYEATEQFFKGNRLDDTFAGQAQHIIDNNVTDWMDRGWEFDTGLNAPYTQAA